MEDWLAWTLILGPAFVFAFSYRRAEWNVVYLITAIAGIFVSICVPLIGNNFAVEPEPWISLFIAALVFASFSLGRLARFGLAVLRSNASPSQPESTRPPVVTHGTPMVAVAIFLWGCAAVIVAAVAWVVYFAWTFSNEL